MIISHPSTPSAPLREKLRLPRRLLFLLLVPLGMGLSQFASQDPERTERLFSGEYYPILSQMFNRITGLVPLSLAEFTVVLGIPAAVAWVVLSIRKAVRSPGEQRQRLLNLLSTLLAVAAGFYFIFVVTCGVNYSRMPFAWHAGLTVRPSSAEELALACVDLIADANRLREGLPEDEEGVFQLEKSVFATGKASRTGFHRLAQEIPALGGDYSPPKPVLLSHLWSYTQITGVFTCWSMEANVNIDVPDFTLPFTMCHEQAHLRGFMREDEANFIAYLACMESEDQAIQYSGASMAAMYAMNTLYQADYERFCELYATYSPGVQRDFAAQSRYWAQFEGPVAEVSDKVNDTYLKANRQTDGVASYGRMVDLLLANYRAKHGVE